MYEFKKSNMLYKNMVQLDLFMQLCAVAAFVNVCYHICSVVAIVVFIIIIAIHYRYDSFLLLIIQLCT